MSNEEAFEPLIIGFCCNWCSYAGADLAGVSRIQYPPNLRVVRVMCSGTLNKLEMAIRAYDPCLSCATHKLDGSIAVKVEIRDAHGQLIDTLANW